MRFLRAVPMLAAAAISADVSAQTSDAYLDPTAQELVAQARARRVTTDRRIAAYQTIAIERMSIGFRAGPIEKLLFRRETATRIDWRRDGPVDIEVLAAREVVPPAQGAPQIPSGLAGSAPTLAFDPVDSEMLLRFDSTVIRHPLAAGSEAHYRFSTGDSTVLQLPGGRTVRLRELRIQPRRRDRHLINGSFWLDMETHAVVQAYFRLANRMEGSGSVPFIGRTSAELDYIAIDYGLWDLRWWLPRTVAARGVMSIGRFNLPVSYERRYSDYEIQGDTLAAAPVPGEAPVMETRPCRPRYGGSISISTARIDPDSLDARFERAWQREQAARDSARAVARDSARARALAGTDTAGVSFCDREFNVTTVRATELLASELLAPSIYDSDAEIIDPEELRAIERRVRRIPGAPWQVRAPVLELPLRDAGLVRYNRIEGLAPALRLRFDAGVATLDAEARYGIADREVRGELGMSHSGGIVESRLATYRRLDVVDVASRPFGTAASVGALVMGRDDNDYFDAAGAELRLRPPPTRQQWYDVRVFAERQRAVATAADFTVFGLFDDDRLFRPNVTADAADQVGGVLRLRAAHGVDPRALRVTGEVELHAEVGDHQFTRPAAQVRATVPLMRALAFGFEGAAGTSTGDVPEQRIWQIGGGSTLRGYGAAAMRGESYWRGRAELGLGLPFVRLAIFGDAGWAGPRTAFTAGRPLRSLGAGIGIMDGLLRLDGARALDGERGWRMHLQFNGVL